MPAPKSARLLVTTAAILGSLALPVTSVTAAEESWFHDPVSGAKRAKQVAVPRQPGHTIGERVRRTRATYRARNGSLAVPVSWARGHTLTAGQAVVIQGRAFTYDDGGLSAATRRTVRRLTSSLSGVTSLSCQGHADFGSTPGGERLLSRQRARAVCGLIERHTTGIATRSSGFGIFRPVVIGGTQSDRIDNRRVVVKVLRAAPISPPSAPYLTSVVTGGTFMRLRFQRPGDDGGSPVTGYQASLDGGRTWAHLSTTGRALLRATITDLTPWTQYTVAVRAVNRVGTGPAGNPVVATTEAVVPEAPHLTTVSPDMTSLTIGFDQPSYDGDAPVTQYQVSLDGGSTWRNVATPGSGPYSVALTGLDPVTSYTVAVRAGNRIGFGPRSNRITASTGQLVTAPGAPHLSSATTQNTTMTLGFEAPVDDGGAAITQYQVSVDSGATWQDVAASGGGPFTVQLSDLMALTYYSVTVRARNVVGASAPSNEIVVRTGCGLRGAASRARAC